MEEINALFHGFSVVLTPFNLLLMMVGIVLGVIIGVLPGLGGANGIAILLPLTFTMPPTSAIIMLSCIYWGTLFAGAITSVLFNIPGETHSVATTFDGYPLAQQGRAGEALTASFTGSFLGALVAVLLITFLAPLVAKFALKFGPPEFFAVYLLTFCSFVGTGKDPSKTIISMMLGFGLAAVGMDTVSGELRMTFGLSELLRGIDFLVVVIGLFGVGEILLQHGGGPGLRGQERQDQPESGAGNLEKLPRYWLTLIRSAAIGCWMGITSGGATAASFMGYGIAKRFRRIATSSAPGNWKADRTRNRRMPGTAALCRCWRWGFRFRHRRGAAGRADGVGPAAGTAAVRRAKGLCLGIDRQHVSVQHRRPDHQLTTVPLFAAILRIPFAIIAPIIIVVRAIGAYTEHGAMLDIWFMLLFGTVAMSEETDYPLAPWCCPWCWETAPKPRFVRP